MKVVSVVGARPQFVKLAPIAHALQAAGHEHMIVHTGQHYDPNLSDVFFSGLGIPESNIHLGIGSGSHGVQTGAMLTALDPVLESADPDWVLVYGDTNSTIAATLSAVKQHLPVAHLEAGLRSFNRRMPEEHNRVLTDHAADLLLAPSDVAMRHLADEGLSDRARLVGDVMVDVCLQIRDAVLASEQPASTTSHPIGGPYLLATLHRPDNTDDPARLAALIESLAALPLPVLLLAHPRLVTRATAAGISLTQGSITQSSPLPYRELVTAVLGSVGVITDSGGLQKEAFLLRRPCTTLRTETEWVETVELGWNVLLPDPHLLDPQKWIQLPQRRCVETEAAPYGSGHAAAAVVECLAGEIRR
ncbi:UDP-N-acetylglucosamine 2-epimerase [Microlunatus phosphovorus NM-1]|uniref:UDP-N-acetylglucosamine 2-epimerase n=1 Tax=Microlunatus phosphovorus (strain ATCC 700054 / DSM 10555 / JCM 9379 / NBRC 101784 / NCIMB 13414 / VKM Ac-1990 / NM-1) TaxID=1032480 RepID=F5XGU8_MICPN|nr:UDP-N-acetylglucosamine 2-epimerase (non-hydrolyzing) [Microlunatus phosphovorus]BAK35580.1 UDP-N-acetylglucosamine 2-epimerase [Microlunatus phosphovorus NM-1]